MWREEEEEEEGGCFSAAELPHSLVGVLVRKCVCLFLEWGCHPDTQSCFRQAVSDLSLWFHRRGVLFDSYFCKKRNKYKSYSGIFTLIIPL